MNVLLLFNKQEQESFDVYVPFSGHARPFTAQNRSKFKIRPRQVDPTSSRRRLTAVKVRWPKKYHEPCDYNLYTALCANITQKHCVKRTLTFRNRVHSRDFPGDRAKVTRTTPSKINMFRHTFPHKTLTRHFETFHVWYSEGFNTVFHV